METKQTNLMYSSWKPRKSFHNIIIPKLFKKFQIANAEYMANKLNQMHVMVNSNKTHLTFLMILAHWIVWTTTNITNLISRYEFSYPHELTETFDNYIIHELWTDTLKLFGTGLYYFKAKVTSIYIYILLLLAVVQYI